MITPLRLNRRDLLTGIFGALASAGLPPCTLAQQRQMRIGLLIPEQQGNREALRRLDIFRTELGRLGWDNDEKLHLDVRWGNGNDGLIEELAGDLVRSRPDALFVIGTKPAVTLRRLAGAIPILFMNITEPVGEGLVASLAHPGGHITGIMNFEMDIGGKWLQLIREAAPRRSRILVLAGTTLWGDGFPATSGMGAPAVTVARVTGAADIRAAFTAFAAEPGGALITTPGYNTNANQKTIIELAASHGLPGIYPNRTFVELGGLMSYSPDDSDQSRHAAIYMDRILRGENPGDLPVQSPAKFRLIINLKTAKALGLIISPSLLARADEVIE